jgi:hypothetical protein
LALVARRDQFIGDRRQIGAAAGRRLGAIGVAEAGFNPFSFGLINGPQSLADNNLLTMFVAAPGGATRFYPAFDKIASQRREWATAP